MDVAGSTVSAAQGDSDGDVPSPRPAAAADGDQASRPDPGRTGGGLPAADGAGSLSGSQAARAFEGASTRRRSVVFEEDDDLDIPDFLK
jgi:cell division protein FtsZ